VFSFAKYNARLQAPPDFAYITLTVLLAIISDSGSICDRLGGRLQGVVICHLGTV